MCWETTIVRQRSRPPNSCSATRGRTARARNDWPAPSHVAYNTSVILMSMSWDVILLEEVETWYFSLDEDAMAAVTGAIDLLELEGPTLGRPTVDKVKGSKFHSMKELRPAGTSIRILFIFDPRRQAILLLGGDKAGNWKSWYDKNIPIAERSYEDWLATEGGE